MAVSKRPRKKMQRKTPVTFPENHIFWFPISVAIYRQSPHIALAVRSDEPIGDTLAETILTPLRRTIERMDNGTAVFQDYWNLVQTCYLYAHCLQYATHDEKYRFSVTDEEAVAGGYADTLAELQAKHWKKLHHDRFKDVEEDVQQTVGVIGERHRRTGKYGVTGDERAVLVRLLNEFDELLGWGTVRMVYTSMRRCEHNLKDIEHQIRKKHNGISNSRL